MKSEIFIMLLSVGAYCDVGTSLQKLYQSWCSLDLNQKVHVYWFIRDHIPESAIAIYETLLSAFKQWDSIQNQFGAPGWKCHDVVEYFMSRRKTDDLKIFVAKVRDLQEIFMQQSMKKLKQTSSFQKATKDSYSCQDFREHMSKKVRTTTSSMSEPLDAIASNPFDQDLESNSWKEFANCTPLSYNNVQDTGLNSKLKCSSYPNVKQPSLKQATLDSHLVSKSSPILLVDTVKSSTSDFVTETSTNSDGKCSTWKEFTTDSFVQNKTDPLTECKAVYSSQLNSGTNSTTPEEKSLIQKNCSTTVIPSETECLLGSELKNKVPSKNLDSFIESDEDLVCRELIVEKCIPRWAPSLFDNGDLQQKPDTLKNYSNSDVIVTPWSSFEVKSFIPSKELPAEDCGRSVTVGRKRKRSTPFTIFPDNITTAVNDDDHDVDDNQFEKDSWKDMPSASSRSDTTESSAKRGQSDNSESCEDTDNDLEELFTSSEVRVPEPELLDEHLPRLPDVEELKASESNIVPIRPNVSELAIDNLPNVLSETHVQRYDKDVKNNDFLNKTTLSHEHSPMKEDRIDPVCTPSDLTDQEITNGASGYHGNITPLLKVTKDIDIRTSIIGDNSNNIANAGERMYESKSHISNSIDSVTNFMQDEGYSRNGVYEQPGYPDRRYRDVMKEEKVLQKFSEERDVLQEQGSADKISGSTDKKSDSTDKKSGSTDKKSDSTDKKSGSTDKKSDSADKKDEQGGILNDRVRKNRPAWESETQTFQMNFQDPNLVCEERSSSDAPSANSSEFLCAKSLKDI